jgi:hypothetical protein
MDLRRLFQPNSTGIFCGFGPLLFWYQNRTTPPAASRSRRYRRALDLCNTLNFHGLLVGPAAAPEERVRTGTLGANPAAGKKPVLWT